MGRHMRDGTLTDMTGNFRFLEWISSALEFSQFNDTIMSAFGKSANVLRFQGYRAVSFLLKTAVNKVFVIDACYQVSFHVSIFAEGWAQGQAILSASSTV